jgi:hypothetical protein
VISVEGLRSPKAIAFISSKLNPKTQTELRTIPNGKIMRLLQIKKPAEDTLNLSLNKTMVI